MRCIPIAFSLCVLAACGDVRPPPVGDDGGIVIDAPEAPPIDAPIDAPDAPDAPPPPPPPPGTARELAVVGGAVSDGRFRFEVEITGGIAARPATGATTTFTPVITVGGN